MNGFVSNFGAAKVLGILAIALAVAGCDGRLASASIRERKIGPSPGELREQQAAGIASRDYYKGERAILRSQADPARGRLWLLTQDGVDLYDARTREKLAHVSLPDWLWAGEPYSCAPDLVLGPEGEALVSSDVVPTLWRIDPVTFAASAYRLVLSEDTGQDVGFTGLVYSPQQGAYFAVSALQGSLWRIDPQLKRAQNIPLSARLPKACAVSILPATANRRASGLVGLCVRTDQGDWTVNLAPDQRSGFARPARCEG